MPRRTAPPSGYYDPTRRHMDVASMKLREALVEKLFDGTAFPRG